MRRARLCTLLGPAALALIAQPLHAQGVVGAATAPPDAALPIRTATSTSSSDPGVDMFYSARAEAPIWLRDEASRAAATKLVRILRFASLDGLPDASDLAGKVGAAVARGEQGDDKFISTAWVRYVRVLKGMPAGFSFGDPTLKPEPPTAEAVLRAAAQAQSLADHVDEVAAVNPLYSAIRSAAIERGATDDPHIRATLERLRLVPPKGRAILVDVATAQLWMLEDGHSVDSMKVVVGKTTSPTPLLAGTIHFVTFNPYWHILDEVVRRKLAPAVLKSGVAYLKSARYETTSDWSSKADRVEPASINWKAVAAGTERAFVRQEPGANNMMGTVKFSFENDFNIFLHDTPHKELFARPRRNFSLGCVRLEHADRLAKWLLGRDEMPPLDKPEYHVQLDKGVPVFITYLTVSAADGQLAFAEDVYGLDPVPRGQTTAESVSNGGISTSQ